MKLILIIILIISSSISAQNKISKNDSTKIFSEKDPIKQIRIDKQNDSLSQKSLLELKTILSSEYFKLDQMRMIMKPVQENEGFTKDELESGLSKNELIAYKRNKEMLFSILQKKFDDNWCYKVKSLGQLIGIPDLVIKMLQFGLLLL